MPIEKTKRRTTINAAAAVILSIVTAAALGCTHPPDLSTPQHAAKAFASALNAGNYKQLVQVLGQANIDRAVADCEKVKSESQPKPLDAHRYAGAFAAFANSLNDIDTAKRDQDCAQIPGDLRSFAKFVGDGHPVRLAGEERHPIGLGAKTSERKLEDGRPFVAFKLQPPDWDGSDGSIEQLVVVKQADGKWVPMFGDSAGVMLANFAFALPSCAEPYDKARVRDAL